MYVQKYKWQNFSQAKYTHCNHTTSRNNLHSQSTRPQDPFQSQAITSRCVWSSRQASTTAFLPRRRQASKQRVYSAEESMVTRYDLVALVSRNAWFWSDFGLRLIIGRFIFNLYFIYLFIFLPSGWAGGWGGGLKTVHLEDCSFICCMGRGVSASESLVFMCANCRCGGCSFISSVVMEGLLVQLRNLFVKTWMSMFDRSS